MWLPTSRSPLDGEGRIVAQLGPLEVNPPGASLATYPLVARALQGYVRDDVWIYDRRVYRMAGRPVLFGGEYVGAIIHGYKFDNAFAEKLSQGLGGAALAFFYGTNVLASYAPDRCEGRPQHWPSWEHRSRACRRTSASFDGDRAQRPMALQSGGRGISRSCLGGAAAAGVGSSSHGRCT